jgi:hypothetical protein
MKVFKLYFSDPHNHLSEAHSLRSEPEAHSHTNHLHPQPTHTNSGSEQGQSPARGPGQNEVTILLWIRGTLTSNRL